MTAAGSYLYEKPEQFPAPANRPSTSVPLGPVEEVIHSICLSCEKITKQ